MELRKAVGILDVANEHRTASGVVGVEVKQGICYSMLNGARILDVMSCEKSKLAFRDVVCK